MKGVVFDRAKVSGCLLAVAVIVLAATTPVYSQAPVTGIVKDVAQDAAKDAAKDAVMDAAKQAVGEPAGAQPVQGQAEMLDGAKMMMEGRNALRQELKKDNKLKEGETLEGGKMMADGHDMVVEGDKQIKAGKTAQGKKQMMDGARMMLNAKKTMTDDLSRKGMVRPAAPSQGEAMMNDAEKKMQRAEMMMLK